MFLNTHISQFLIKLREGEHEGFGVTMVKEIKADAESIAELAPAWASYEAVIYHETLLFKLSKASPETREITDEDHLRDKIFREVRRLLKYYSKGVDPDRRHAAQKLIFAMKPYSTSDKRTIFGETSFISNFLTEFQDASNVQAIALLPGLSEMLVDLTATNTKVDTLYIQRLHTVEELEALGKRADVRKDADHSLVRFLEAVNTVYDYNEMTSKTASVKETLLRIAMRVNGLVAKLQAMLAQRGHKRSGKPGDDQKPKPPTPPAPPTDPQNPDNTLPPAPPTPPQNPDTTIPPINPDELDPPAVGER
ncbi:MAG: DUF6261 family protein [Tannerellaceae bacterium]|jgi:hypothetical protein|nr:DUF6261 family protein [Tannerellaceae bacterium]